MRRALRSLIRQPAVHLAVAGAVLFGLHAAVNSDRGDTIEVTEAQLERWRQDFRDRYGRAPDKAELRGRIQRYIEREMLFREALSQDLHRIDPVVRRRLISTMRFLSGDTAADGEPTEARLRAYWQAHREAFRRPARYDLRHVFVDPQGGRNAARTRAERLLGRLRSGADAAALGDPFLSGRQLAGKTRAALAGTFGDDFAAEVAELEPGRWQGPVASSYGLHLVRVERRREARDPPFEEVRGAVLQAWREDNARPRDLALAEELRGRYSVRLPAGWSP